eukprot:501793-Rhodomonas_salina.2
MELRMTNNEEGGAGGSNLEAVYLEYMAKINTLVTLSSVADKAANSFKKSASSSSLSSLNDCARQRPSDGLFDFLREPSSSSSVLTRSSSAPSSPLPSARHSRNLEDANECTDLPSGSGSFFLYKFDTDSPRKGMRMSRTNSRSFTA